MKVLIISVYVLMLLIIGYLSMKKTKSVDDFFLGNRSIGPWVYAFAYGTTYFSAVVFIGYAGKVGWGFWPVFPVDRLRHYLSRHHACLDHFS